MSSVPPNDWPPLDLVLPDLHLDPVPPDFDFADAFQSLELIGETPRRQLDR